MSLGSRINDIRKEKGISLDELCERSGVPKGTLSKITAGITDNPTLETVKAIARALGCTLDDFDDEPRKETKTPAPEESEAGDKVSMEELTAFLTKAGYIEDGGDLSDSDFEFLAHLIGLLDLWCKSR